MEALNVLMKQNLVGWVYSPAILPTSSKTVGGYTHPTWLICVALVFLSSTFLHAAEVAPADVEFPDTRTGAFEARYPVLPEVESSKLVAMACARNNHLPLPAYTRAALWKRAGEVEKQQNLRGPEAGADVQSDEADPPFYSMYVPPDYVPGAYFGLLVWNSAGPRGDIPKQYRDVCDRHHLIWCGAANVGNYRNSAWRIYMPLEAAAQARRRFTIDPKRVYVSGASGGGRVSSRATIFFPDIFSGGIYCIGCDYYRTVPASNHPGNSWHGFWLAPDAKLLEKAKAQSRLVVLEGSKDPNTDDARDFFAAYQKDGFKHVSYLEVPDMGHATPPGNWFEKAVVALDEPLPAADALEGIASSAERNNERGEAYRASARLALLELHTPRGALAWQAASRIYVEFAPKIAAIRGQIKAGQLAPAAKALTTLRAAGYGPMASDFAADVEEQLRAPASKAR